MLAPNILDSREWGFDVGPALPRVHELVGTRAEETREYEPYDELRAEKTHDYDARISGYETAVGLIQYEEFHPYGTTAYRAGDSGIDVSPRRYRYTGMEQDEETGLGYHTARYYAGWLGRWTASDPIGLGGGVNRYGYVEGRVGGSSDASGLKGPRDKQPKESPEATMKRLQDQSGTATLDQFGIKPSKAAPPKNQAPPKAQGPDPDSDSKSNSFKTGGLADLREQPSTEGDPAFKKAPGVYFGVLPGDAGVEIERVSSRTGEVTKQVWLRSQPDPEDPALQGVFGDRRPYEILRETDEEQFQYMKQRVVEDHVPIEQAAREFKLIGDQKLLEVTEGAMGILMFAPTAFAAVGMLRFHPRDSLPTRDGTGKLHGELLDSKDFSLYHREELEMYQAELKASIEKRISVTAQKGTDLGHAARQFDEEEVLRKLTKYLESTQ